MHHSFEQPGVIAGRPIFEPLDSRVLLAAHIDGTEYPTIQEAVTAAVDGNTITIDAGTYVEQINIDKNVTLIGTGDDTIIKAPATLASFFQGANSYNVVVNVHNTDAAIINVKVDGDGKGNGGGQFIGVGFFDAGGLIDNVTTVGTRDTPQSGAQDGVGILGRNTVAAPRSLTISNSDVSDYNKNGITVNDIVGDQLTATISNNTVTGSGPLGLGLAAQNGIQIYNVSSASSVTGNTVSGNYYTPATFVAAGILLWQVDAGTTVSGNTVTASNAGIAQINGSSTMAGNTLTGNDYGVVAYDGTIAVTGNDFDDAADNLLDVYVSPTSTMTSGGNQYAGDDGYIYNDSAASINATGDSFDEASNFRVEDKMIHALDAAGTGLITWVAGNLFVTTPEARSTDSSIQSAHDAAAAGDTLNIEDGTYTEQISITKGLTITGESEAGTIIQAGETAGLANNGKNVFTIAAPAGTEVTLQQMTVRNSDYGVRSTSGNVSIFNATFYHNGFDGVAFPTGSQAAADAHYDAHATDGGAIRLQGSSNSVLANLTVYENDRGIRLADGDNAHVHDNVSFGNIQAGIYLSATTGATGPTSPGMTNSVVENNQSYDNANNGILVVGGDNITVRGNDVHDNWNSGVMVWYPSEVILDGNAIAGNNAFGFNGEGNTGDAAGGGVSVFGSNAGAGGEFAIKVMNNAITSNGAGRNTESQGIRFESPAAAVASTIGCNTISDHDVGAHLEGHDFALSGNSISAQDVGVRVATAATAMMHGNDLMQGTLRVENTSGTEVDARFNWWGTADQTVIAALVTGDTEYIPFLLGKVSDSLVFLDEGGGSMIVNSATGAFRLVVGTTTYAGTGARLENGVLKIHDQTAAGKVDAVGDEEGEIDISLKVDGKPRVYTMEAYSLFDCLTDDDEDDE